MFWGVGMGNVGVNRCLFYGVNDVLYEISYGCIEIREIVEYRRWFYRR